MKLHRPIRQATTLVELLVVLGILGFTLGLVLVGIQKCREAMSVCTCRNNLRQLGLAIQHHQGTVGTMPPYSTGFPPGTPHANWLVYLMPYIDDLSARNAVPNTTQNQIDPNSTVTGTGLSAVQVKVIRCPTDPSTNLETYWSTTNYLANWYALSGSGGYWGPPRPTTALPNGSSGTVLLAEAYSLCNNLPRMAMTATFYHNFGITQEERQSDDPSYLPEDYTMFQVRPALHGPGRCHKWRTQTPHLAMNVGMGDGSVRSVEGGISPLTWKQMLGATGSAP
jgi:type II secretory pathway pseudopilin PulG